jgi:hypothetical protein
MAATPFAVGSQSAVRATAQAKFAQTARESTGPPKSLVAPIDWMMPFKLVTGVVAGFATPSPPRPPSSPIVFGAMGSALLCKAVKPKPSCENAVRRHLLGVSVASPATGGLS